MTKDLFDTSGMKVGEWITGREAIDLMFPSFSEEQKQALLDLSHQAPRTRVVDIETSTITLARNPSGR